MSIESVILPKNLMLCHPLLLGLQSFPVSGSFLVSQVFASGGHTIGIWASASVLPMNIQGWFPLGMTGLISLQSRTLNCLLQHYDLKASILHHFNLHIKKQRHYFVNKSPSSQGYGFSSSHEWMWELNCKESWEPKNWDFWTVVLEKTLESPLDCKEIQPKENQPWKFIGRTDAEAEAPMASPTQWTWVWEGSGSWWWTGRSGVLQSMGSQRVGHDWVTELTELNPSPADTC